jgi:hypothetical protein
MLTPRKRVRLLTTLLFFALVALFVLPPQSALAAGGTVTDQASCEAIGGSWNVFLFPTCSVTDLTIYLGETLTIGSGVNLAVNGTIINRDTINNNGTIYISSDSTIQNGIFVEHNPGNPSIFNNNGTIYNNGTLDNRYGTLDNNGTVLNNADALIENGRNNANGPGSSGVINNYSTIRNEDGRIFNNKGTLNNYNTIENNGFLRNGQPEGFLRYPGVLNNIGTIVNNSTMINSGGPFSNAGIIDNNGVVYTDDTIRNSGTTNNYGSFATASIQILGGGIVNNFGNIGSGTIRIDYNGTLLNDGNLSGRTFIYNEGTLNNNGSATGTFITNDRTFNNNGFITDASIYNVGTFNNNGYTNTAGSITNDGTLTNAGTIDFATPVNAGSFQNRAGGTLYNYHIIYTSHESLFRSESLIINNNGTIENSGLFEHFGLMDNAGYILNYGEMLNDGEILNGGVIHNSIGLIYNDCNGTISGNAVSGKDVIDICDYTPPIITHSVSGVLGNNSWYVSDVTVSWTVTDNESEITDIDGCVNATISFDTAGWSLNCTATSKGGTAYSGVAFKRDATAPTASASVSPDPNVNGWNNTDVTVSFSGTDNMSGVASCDAPVVLSGEGTNQSASGTCTDMAGNLSATATASNINIDKTAPDVFVTGVVDGETYILGTVPAAGCDTQDSLSGVATFASHTVTGGDANGVGTITATCAGATDNAGNSGTASVNYTVITPSDATVNLIDEVESLNLQQGMDTSLDVILDAALQALDDLSQNNDVAATNALEAFINAVEAQRGKKVTNAEADTLIAGAQAIIDAIIAN